MNTQVIPLSQIDEPRGREQSAPYREATAKKIAESVQILGLLQPIGVVTLPDTNRYELVFGRHRLGAYRDYLKEEAIRCSVFPDWDEEDRAIAGVVENLYRSEPSREQFLLNVRKWAKYHESRHPDHATEGAAVPSFQTMLCGVTGQSKSSAERTVKIALAFDPEQITVLCARKTKQGDMESLAGVKGKTDRDRAVSLVAGGMDASEAVSQVAGFDATEPDEISQVVLGQIESLKRLVADMGRASGHERLRLLYRSLTEFEWAATNGKEAELSDALEGILWE